jgi:hypothetical protein
MRAEANRGAPVDMRTIDIFASSRRRTKERARADGLREMIPFW